MITLDELIFDPSNPDDGANVGATLRGADGTVIGNTGDALKVTGDFNITNAEVEISNDVGNPIPVNATDLDIRDLSAAQDNVAISDGTDTLAVNPDGSINTNFAAGASVEITDGTDTLEINADGSVNAVVTATDLDIRDLTFANDSVDVTGSEIKEDAYATFKATNQTISNTASQIASTALTDRRRITIQNLGTKPIYIGENGSVTDNTGVRVSRGASIEILAKDTATLFAITPSGTADVRILEAAY